MKFEHLKLQALAGEYKYVRFRSEAEFADVAARVGQQNTDSVVLLFRTRDEFSALVPAELPLECESEQRNWNAFRILGEMPFGTVQGLIASVSGALASSGIGVCVISTFATDLFFVRRSNREAAVECLRAAGWEVIS